MNPALCGYVLGSLVRFPANTLQFADEEPENLE